MTARPKKRPSHKIRRALTFSPAPQFYTMLSAPWGVQLNMSAVAHFSYTEVDCEGTRCTLWSADVASTSQKHKFALPKYNHKKSACNK